MRQRSETRLQTKITLLIMVYNNEDYIERALDSILKNDTQNYDVIINDDCSTDASLSVAERFLSSNADLTCRWRIRRSTKNLGINASLYNVLQESKNNWIKYMAADDELEPGSLEIYRKLAYQNSPDSCIILSHMNVIDINSRYVGRRKSLSSYFYENSFLKPANFYINTINAPTVMIGRDSLSSALRTTTAKNAEDWPVLRFCILRNFKFVVCSSPLVKYRIHHASLSSAYNFSGVANQISDQVEILLKENRSMTKNIFSKIGICLQLKTLYAEDGTEVLFWKMLKLLNLQFFIFKVFAVIDGLSRDFDS